MFTNAFKIGSLFGFPIKIDPSWLLIAALLTWSLAAGYFPQAYPELATRTYWIMGLVGMLGLFLSVLLHELGHALVARRYGLEMGGITLFIFGGVAEMSAQPESPKAEFWVAVGGPAVTVVLVGLFGALTALGLPEALGAITAYLAFVNLVLLIFNLVPAFPLDGGRVLRAWLWHRKGSLRAGTRIAAQFGSGFGFFLMGLGLLQLFQGQLIGAIWSAVLGLFLRGVAQASYRDVVFRHALEGKHVRYFMTENPVTVTPELKLSQFVEDYLYRHHHKLYPVMEAGELLGVVGPAEVQQVDRNEWEAAAVDRVMQRLEDGMCLSPDAPAKGALEQMQKSGRSRMLVVDEQHGEKRLVGVLTLKDLIAFLSLKMELEEDDDASFLQTKGEMKAGSS